MRDIASLANQCTDDIFDTPMGAGSWGITEKEIAECLTAERERCALLAEFYGHVVLAKAIRDGAFVDEPLGAWWEDDNGV